ncbi:MAG TPA: PaaI family thioesterase [Marmoricola sp.]|nr:PaaI family thioesterase [Marmoricola sp.]
MTEHLTTNPCADLNAYLEGKVPNIHNFGIRVSELGRGSVTATAPLAGNGNHLNTMYAGTTFALAEMLGGAIVWPLIDFGQYYPTVKDLQIRYRRPAFTDLTGRASLNEKTITRMLTEATTLGKTEFEVEAHIVDDAGTTVATSHGTYQIRRFEAAQA